MELARSMHILEESTGTFCPDGFRGLYSFQKKVLVDDKELLYSGVIEICEFLAKTEDRFLEGTDIEAVFGFVTMRVMI